jgi:hypothetical protein
MAVRQAGEALPPLEPGAMRCMMSKQDCLNDDVGHWMPHLMFCAPHDADWGADLPGSPVMLSPQFHDCPEPVNGVHGSDRQVVRWHGRAGEAGNPGLAFRWMPGHASSAAQRSAPLGDTSSCKRNRYRWFRRSS